MKQALRQNWARTISPFGFRGVKSVDGFENLTDSLASKKRFSHMTTATIIGSGTNGLSLLLFSPPQGSR
jgi:hypothetical protein